MRIGIREFVAVCVLMGCGGAFARADSHEAEADAAPIPGSLTMGAFSSEDEFYGQGDILIPLIRLDHGLFFFNPRGTLSNRREQELNIGLGLRRIFEGHYPFILGANAYYDARWTRNDIRFDQLGLGVEFLSDSVDARANYYLPNRTEKRIDRLETETVERRSRTETYREHGWGDPYAREHDILQDDIDRTVTRFITSTRTLRQVFERHEAALEGFDGELGIRIGSTDWPVQPRLFGGYQHFEHPFADDLKGWKGRLELRALDGRLTLDAHWYENDDLNRGNYLLGARVTLPFDPAALAQGRNPFARQDSAVPGSLPARLNERVMRDPKIHTRESGYREDASQRTVRIRERNRTVVDDATQTHVLAEGVVFVQGDVGHDANPGTAEAPKATVQGGVDEAAERDPTQLLNGWPDDVERRVVYIHDSSTPYAGAELNDPRVALIGQGFAFEGHGGKMYGGDAFPVMEGVDEALWISDMAEYAAVAGMEITTHGTGSAISSNTGRITILNNTIHGNVDGVFSMVGGDVEAWIQGNRFEDNADSGVYFLGFGEGPEPDAHGFHLDVTGNEFRGGGVALEAMAIFYGSADIWVANNTVTGAEMAGLSAGALADNDATGEFRVTLRDNTVFGVSEGNTANGITGYTLAGQGDAMVIIDNNTVTGEFDRGIQAEAQAQGTGDAVVLVRNNLSSQNSYGIHASASAEADGDALVVIQENQADHNSRFGIWADTTAHGDDSVSHVIAMENQASFNGHSDEGLPVGGGLFLNAVSSAHSALVYALDNTVSDNTGYGIDAIAEGPEAQTNLLNNEADNNVWGLRGRAIGGDARVWAIGNRATHHTHDIVRAQGLFLEVQADVLDDSEPMIFGHENVLRDNDEGFLVSYDGPLPSAATNVAQLWMNSMGNNSTGNLWFHSVPGANMNASMNWWGGTEPAQFGITEIGGGTVDSSGWLDEDPNP